MPVRLKMWMSHTSVKQGVTIYILVRLLLVLWATVTLALNPIPVEPDEVTRPYLGEPQLNERVVGWLLGPWQRFDTQRYMRIARQGYTDVADSVFPPFYPITVRALGALFGGSSVANLSVGLLLSNIACLALFILLHRVISAELDASSATRALVYFALFPTGFFLFAAYTESLFVLLALSTLWAAQRGHFWLAGFLGALAALTRLTGWVLIVPLAYQYWHQHRSFLKKSLFSGITLHFSPPISSTPYSKHAISVLAILLPALALATFLAWRWSVGLPSLNAVYQQFWYQTTGFPGRDIITALQTLFFGGTARSNEIISLAFDFACTLLLILSTIFVFRHLNPIYGLYSAMLLFFILLPTSDVKPLYSFSRYTLAFFPTFMLLGLAGRRPWVNRLILYPSVALYLYFSGQFFIWGWVA